MICERCKQRPAHYGAVDAKGRSMELCYPCWSYLFDLSNDLPRGPYDPNEQPPAVCSPNRH